jgi:hypothetical protein
MNAILTLNLVLLFMGVCGTIFTILRIKAADRRPQEADPHPPRVRADGIPA